MGLCIFLLVLYRLQFSESVEACEAVSFQHPYAHNKSITPAEVYSTSKGFCLMYPRCLAYNCCDKALEDHVTKVYSSAYCNEYAPFECMKSHTKACSYNESFSSRSANLSVFNGTMTVEKLYDGLLSLSPTPPALFKALEHRCEFKVLYLAQGDNRSDVSTSILNYTSDFIFLNYKIEEKGTTIMYTTYIHLRI